MESGYFYYFINEKELENFMDYNNIDNCVNIFFYLGFDIFLSVVSEITNDKNSYYEININNNKYYIYLQKGYKINFNLYKLNYYSKIKHGKLEEKLLDIYLPIEEKQNDIGRIFEIKNECKVIKCINNQEINLARTKKILVINVEKEEYIIAKIYNKANSTRIPVYEENNNIYGYIDLNYTYKTIKKELSNASKNKLIVAPLQDKLVELKKEIKVLEEEKMKQKKTSKKTEIKQLEESQEFKLENITVYIRKRINSCTINNHNIDECVGNLMLINKIGNLLNKDVVLFFCKNCNKYVMSEIDYENLLRYGKPFCKIINEVVKKNDSRNFSMNEESELYCYGYNVNQTENLTTDQRRKILTLLIDNNLMSKNKIMNHLSYLINSRRNMNNFRYAISKWKEDNEFVSKYNKQNLKNYKIATIKRKEYL